METFAEAAARESNEEVTMGISASGFGVPRMSVPYADDIPIIVEFRNGERVASSMKLVGSFFPSDSFRELAAGCKRVHLTTAYMTVVEIGRRLTCEEIEGFFMSGDDAKEVVVLAESDFDGAPFKEGHHRMIFDKARKLLG